MHSRQRVALATILAVIMVTAIILVGLVPGRALDEAEGGGSSTTSTTTQLTIPPGVGPGVGDEEGDVPWGLPPGSDQGPGVDPGGDQPAPGTQAPDPQPGNGGPPPPFEPQATLDDSDVIARYDVVDGHLEGGPYPEPHPAHVAMWEFAAQLMPASTLASMNEFVVFTDGIQNILGAVVPTSPDHSTWSLQLDLADRNDRRMFLRTVIHELAHLITLRTDQIEDVVPLGEAVECGDRLPLPDSCAREGSYLDGWGDRFWADKLDQWLELQDLTGPEYATAAGEFYTDHREDFSTDYAMTSPAEDMAEAFVDFILEPAPGSTATEVEQKLTYLFNQPELVEIRREMRAQLDLD